MKKNYKPKKITLIERRKLKKQFPKLGGKNEGQ